METPLITLNTSLAFKGITDNQATAPAASSSGKGNTRVLYTLEGVQMGCVGEAKGHGVHLERIFWEKIVELGNAEKEGVMLSFGHPGFCSESLGRQIGFSKNYRMEGDVCVADFEIHALSNILNKNGDFLKEMAATMPHKFGNSIEFYDTDKYQYTENGEKFILHDNGAILKNESGTVYNEKKHGKLKGEIYVYPKTYRGSAVVERPASNNGKGLFSHPVVEFMRFFQIGQKQLKKILASLPEIQEEKEPEPNINFQEDTTDMKKFSLTSLNGLVFHFEKQEADIVAIPTKGDRISDTQAQPVNGTHPFSYGTISFEVIAIDGLVSEVKQTVAATPAPAPVNQQTDLEAFEQKIMTKIGEQFSVMQAEIKELKEATEGLKRYSAPAARAVGGEKAPEVKTFY